MGACASSPKAPIVVDPASEAKPTPPSIIKMPSGASLGKGTPELSEASSQRRVSFPDSMVSPPERRSHGDDSRRSSEVVLDEADSDDGEPERPPIRRSISSPSRMRLSIESDAGPAPTVGPVTASARLSGASAQQDAMRDVMAARRSEPEGTCLEPLGKHVLRRGVLTRAESGRSLARQRSATGSLVARGRAKLTFTPAALSSKSRETARERLRIALRDHFLFRSLETEQIEAAVRRAATAPPGQRGVRPGSTRRSV